MSIVKMLFMLSLIVLSKEVCVAGGTDVIFGGDTILTDFRYLIKLNESVIDRIPDVFLPTENFKGAYAEYSNSVQISLRAELSLNEQPLMAINYPNRNPPEIFLSRALWKFDLNSTEDDYQKYKKIALHEMLHVMKLDDSKYYFSEQIFQLIELFSQGHQSLPAFMMKYVLRPHPMRDVAVKLITDEKFILSDFFYKYRYDESLFFLAYFAHTNENIEQNNKVSKNIRAMSENVQPANSENKDDYKCTISELLKDNNSDMNAAAQNLLLKGYSKQEQGACYFSF